MGKTSIIKRIMGEEFTETQATIGNEFSKKEEIFQDSEDPKKTVKVILKIWDTCTIIQKLFYNSRS